MPAATKTENKLFYGWIIVATFFAIGLIIFGIRMSFGIFFKSIESEFLLTRTATSAIFSVYMAIGAMSALLGGWAIDRYGPRIVILLMGLSTGLGLLLTSQTNAAWQLFITYSLMLSVGSVMFTVLSTTIVRWFYKKRTFALGIAQSGAGFGQVFVAPLAALLISTLDWRMSFVVLGLVAWLIILPLSRLLKKEPSEIGIGSYGNPVNLESKENNVIPTPVSSFSLTRIFRTGNIWFIWFATLFFGSCLFLVSTHLVPHATDIGISAENAATIISLMGISAIASRIIIGMVADRIGKKRSAVISMSLQTLAMFWLVWAQELWEFYLFALVFGFGYGGFAPALSSLVGDTFELRRLGSIMGIVDVGFFTGSAIGPVIGGLIFDLSNNYIAAFFYGASATIMAALLISMVRQKKDLSGGKPNEG